MNIFQVYMIGAALSGLFALWSFHAQNRLTGEPVTEYERRSLPRWVFESAAFWPIMIPLNLVLWIVILWEHKVRR